MLSNVVNTNVEIVALKLFNVVNFNVDIHNVVSTLIWYSQDVVNVDVKTSYHPNNNVKITLKGFLGIEECC